MFEPSAGSFTIKRPTGAIYLDHHATTPVDPRVATVVMRSMSEEFGNANGVENLHGERAARTVADAKEQIASVLSAAAEDVHFTSGSTEAIQLALSHAIAAADAPLRVAISTVEHKAVIETVARAQRMGLCRMTCLPVDSEGRLEWSRFEDVVRDGIDLVCVMAANNEVGTTYPVSEIAAAVRGAGGQVLVDATQAVGRLPIDVDSDGLDYVVVSAHKIYGPKGVGALVSPRFDRHHFLGLHGAHQPTPNVPGIAGMGQAFELIAHEGARENERLGQMRDRLLYRLQSQVKDLVVNGSMRNRLAHNLHFSALGAPNDIVLMRLRGRVSLSTGSACNTGAQEPSHVLRAMRLDADRIDSALRIGLGRSTSTEDVDTASTLIADAIADVRQTVSGTNYA